MADFFKGINLNKKHGENFIKVDPEIVLKEKVVAIYFCSNVEPCQRYTPMLKNFYEDLKEEPFEIVIISCDADERQMNITLHDAHDDWCRLESFDEQFANELIAKYNIPGVPTVVIIKSDGKEVEQMTDVEPSKGHPAMVTFMKWKMSCIGV